MDKNNIIKEVTKYLKKEFNHENTGHDYWHFMRVWKVAKEIAKKEGGDLFTIELGALLHDIADWKFNKGSHDVGIKKAQKLLKKLRVDERTITHICYIIEHISFKGAKVKNDKQTKESMIVQDADKLDAMGAIGIARVFAYGGSNNRSIYHPEIKVTLHKSFKTYQNSKGTSINHFYEKLLLLKNRMNTKTAKKIAEKRHKFLENYLKQFLREWDVKL